MNRTDESFKFSFQMFHTALVVLYCICLSSISFAIQQPQLFDVIGLRKLVETEPNLTGFGVRISTIGRSTTYTNGIPDGNYQIDMRHQAFWGANVQFENRLNTNAGYSPHETAIAGLLLGLDPYAYNSQAGSFDYRGACPDAEVEAFEFWRFVSLYVFGERDFDADILMLSLGDVFPSWWTRGIEKIAARKGIVLIAAAGNGRNVGDPVLYPAAGSNAIAVGVINAAIDPITNETSLSSFASANPSNSSNGPTADSRCKPDIVAPGRGLIPIANSNNGYMIGGNWTSLAAPVVSGAAALLLQKAKAEPSLSGPIFSENNTHSIIKAILMTSADKLPFWHKGLPDPNDDAAAPLDYNQGAGVINIDDAYHLLIHGKQTEKLVTEIGWDNNKIDPNKPYIQYEFEYADPNAAMITATVCWNRSYQDNYPYLPVYEGNSDLRLELWGIDPNFSENNTLLDVSDSPKDNVEHLYTAIDPRFNRYRIVVRFGGKVIESQQYAVAWMAGAEKNKDNPFWYDLNNDGKINNEDRLIYFQIDQNKTQWLETENGSKTFHLDSVRLKTLMTLWQHFKSKLIRWS